MATGTREVSRAQFGPLAVDVQRRELLVEGMPIEVGTRAFDVALLLIEAGGELVTKDEIMRRVWRGAIVEENSIQVAVSALRRTLGAHGSTIRTVSGRGYRLVASSPPQGNTNLPAATSELIGREAALEALAKLLASNRIVTLTGAGGIGKTRLAVEAGRQQLPHHPDGVWIAELASLTDPKSIPHAVASALGLELPDSLSQSVRIASAVAQRQLLLILDNCEQVVDAIAELAFNLVRANAKLRILATSREPLRIEGETLYRVPPLTAPQESETDTVAIPNYGAVRLFLARTQAANPVVPIDRKSLAAIGSICRRLDGIPLAIEIAAARSAVFGVADLSKRLDDQFRLLTSGFRTGLPRHRTLSATLDWSYDLLNDAERRGLRRISMAVGRFSLSMAAALMSDSSDSAESPAETLAGLIAKSLVVPEPFEGEIWHRLLETTRAYAMAKLKETDEFNEVARRHARYCLDVMSSAEIDWEGHVRSEDLEGVEATDSLVGNARQAIEWAFSSEGDANLGLLLTIAAVPIWMHLSMVRECRQNTVRALEAFAIRPDYDPVLEMKLLTAHSLALVSTMATGPDVRRGFSRALAISEDLGNKDYEIRNLWGLCAACVNEGEFFEARALASRLHELVTSDDRSAMASADLLLGGVLHVLGDHAQARKHMERILEQPRVLLDRPSSSRFLFNRRVLALGLLGTILWYQGHIDQSRQRLEESVAEALSKDHVLSLCMTLGNWVCMIMLLRGELDEAERHRAILSEHASRYGLEFWVLWARVFDSVLSVRLGDAKLGVTKVHAALAELGERSLHPRFTQLRFMLADALFRAAEFEQAQAIAESILVLAKDKGQLWVVPELLRLQGDIAARRDARGRDAAGRLFRDSLVIARQQGSLVGELKASMSMVRLARSDTSARDQLEQTYKQFSEGLQTTDLKEARQLLRPFRPTPATSNQRTNKQ